MPRLYRIVVATNVLAMSLRYSNAVLPGPEQPRTWRYCSGGTVNDCAVAMAARWR